MFGIVVYGFYFGTCIALAHAVSEGARASVAGITAGERANFAEAQVRAIFARYAPLLSDDAAHREIAAAPLSEPGPRPEGVRVVEAFVSTGRSRCLPAHIKKKHHHIQ